MQRMTQTNFEVILTIFVQVIDQFRESTKKKQQQQQQQQNSPLLLGRRRSFGSSASKNDICGPRRRKFLGKLGNIQKQARKRAKPPSRGRRMWEGLEQC